MAPSSSKRIPRPPHAHPFRRAVMRGLAVVLPPLLTIVIFLWVGNTVATKLLDPLEDRAIRWVTWKIRDIRSNLPVDPATGAATVDGVTYVQTADGKFVPQQVFATVEANLATQPMPSTAQGVYETYVQQTYLQRHITVPVFLIVFILVLYLLGRFLAAGVGNFFWTRLENGIIQLPLVRNVYSSVKQVTDFMFNEREIEYTRVVAVEYPRKGVWSLALVTGESMLDIRGAANEPVISVLVPTSPMPFTGFTITVKKSEAIDLNITIDQAFQFIVSCGVVVPPQQLQKVIAEQESASLVSGNGSATLPGQSDTSKITHEAGPPSE